MATAKMLGHYWSGALGNFGAADVGRYEVRTSVHKSACLLLHPEDNDDATFVLMVGTAPVFWFAGSIKGIDGKRKEFWSDPVGGRPCYFVPQSELSASTP